MLRVHRSDATSQTQQVKQKQTHYMCLSSFRQWVLIERGIAIKQSIRLTMLPGFNMNYFEHH
jgi:hypothetical protein